MSNVIGHAIISCKNYVDRHFPNEIEKLKEILDEKTYNTLVNTEGGKYYDINNFININKAISQTFGNNELDIIRDLGRYSATEAVRGVFKAFFKFGSPEFIMKISESVFSKYYDKGKLKLINSTKDSVTGELTGLDIEDKKDVKYICIRVEGWIERSMEISAGKKAKTTQSKCISRGDDSCVFVTEWEL